MALITLGWWRVFVDTKLTRVGYDFRMLKILLLFPLCVAITACASSHNNYRNSIDNDMKIGIFWSQVFKYRAIVNNGHPRDAEFSKKCENSLYPKWTRQWDELNIETTNKNPYETCIQIMRYVYRTESPYWSINMEDKFNNAYANYKLMIRLWPIELNTVLYRHTQYDSKYNFACSLGRSNGWSPTYSKLGIPKKENNPMSECLNTMRYLFRYNNDEWVKEYKKYRRNKRKEPEIKDLEERIEYLEMKTL